MAEEAIHVVWVGSGSGQEEPGIIMKKRPVIAHIKARSKHYFQTETAWHKKKKKKPIKA